MRCEHVFMRRQFRQLRDVVTDYVGGKATASHCCCMAAVSWCEHSANVDPLLCRSAANMYIRGSVLVDYVLVDLVKNSQTMSTKCCAFLSVCLSACIYTNSLQAPRMRISFALSYFLAGFLANEAMKIWKKTHIDVKFHKREFSGECHKFTTCVAVELPTKCGNLRYHTRCYFNVRSKADMSHLNIPHENDN